MININPGHNSALQKKCKSLYDYVRYVGRIAENKKQGLSTQEAIEDAKSFYANGVSVELIAKSLQMTVEQVENIVKDTIQKEA